MIQLPRRSVTRFFIPLIDVLTLLFCIFLLMPLIKTAGEGEGGTGDTATAAETGKDKPAPNPAGEDERAAAERVRREQQELDRIRREKVETLQQRLYIRVLEIDADTGKLYAQEGDQRIEVAGEADVQRLIAAHRREARDRELYYLFLYPRRLTGYPEEGQVRQYETWFKDVAHGIDNPRGGR